MVIYINKITILLNRFKHEYIPLRKLTILNEFISKCLHRRKGHIIATYADNLCLPFALLLAKTLRPFAVCILFLNPCTLLLDLFLGWNVIFISHYTSFNILNHGYFYATHKAHRSYYSSKSRIRQVFIDNFQTFNYF